MNRWLERLKFALLACPLAACDDDAPKVPARATPVASSGLHFVKPAVVAECSRVLLEVCGEGACANFETTRRWVLTRREPGCVSGAVGTCGSYRFVAKNSGFDRLEAYFGSNGGLVALTVGNDTSDNCAWGAMPTCTMTITENMCP